MDGELTWHWRSTVLVDVLAGRALVKQHIGVDRVGPQGRAVHESLSESLGLVIEGAELHLIAGSPSLLMLIPHDDQLNEFYLFCEINSISDY